jgi:hypothetical protein
MGSVSAKIVLRRVDDEGNVVTICEKPFESFVSNFLTLLSNSMAGTAKFSVLDVAGSSVSISPGGITKIDAPVGTASYGIVVGAGTTPVGADDFCIESPIDDGDADGRLLYMATNVRPVEVVGDTITMRVSRGFFNVGAVPVSINEVGLVANIGGRAVLLSRDILVGQVIPADDGLMIDVVFQTTV